MNHKSRTCVAYVAGRLITGIASSTIFDFSRSKHILINGVVQDGYVNVYDAERKCYFSGTMPSLFDYGSRGHIDLKIIGNQFSGFDYATNSHFYGTVQPESISLFDHQSSQHYFFSL